MESQSYLSGWSGGIAYAIGDVANVSLTSDVGLQSVSAVLSAEVSFGLTDYHVFISGDYAVLPGVTLALDLGYGGLVHKKYLLKCPWLFWCISRQSSLLS